MATRYPPTKERLWLRVVKTDTCWLWTGATWNGYGVIYHNGKQDGAHRVAWQLTYGPIPEGMWVLHHCDVRNCVRPDHLFLGTIDDNNRDMGTKGRRRGNSARGDQRKGGGRKLTEVQVLQIRAMWETGEHSQGFIAAQFGVNQQNVSNIIHRKTWTHI
jgi:hypothetical protein